MSNLQRKGPSDSSSKNPAAGGGVRSSSSQHQPAAGTPNSPFRMAIFTLIMKKAEQFNVVVNFTEVQNFARDYADENPPINPPKGKIFRQEDVEAAFERFASQHPQPAPQPAPQPLHRLTGRDKLIRTLTANGLAALPLHLQEKLKTFRMMSKCLFYVEGLDDQKLKHLQKSLCNIARGVLLGVIAISRDHTPEKSEGLKLSLFKQSSKNGGRYTNHDVNSITIVCVICHGTRKFVMTEGDEFKVEKGDEFGSSALYGSRASEYIQMSCALSSHIQALQERIPNQPFVPMSEDCLADKSSASDPSFEAFCRDIMTSQGCVVVPPFSAPTVTKMHASSAEVAGEAPVESLMISCYHGYRVKNFDGKYQPCQDCLRHPGTKPILDGWNEAVGYQQAP